MATLLTLRKARKLEAKIQAAVNAVTSDMTQTTNISIHDDAPMEKLEAVRLKQDTLQKKALALISLRYKIREHIGAMNAASGLDGLLSQKEALNAQRQVLAPVVAAGTTPTEVIIHRTIESAREQAQKGGTSYSRPAEYVGVPVPSAEYVEQVRELDYQLRQQAEAIDDKLIHINSAQDYMVVLTADEVEFLQREKIM